MLRRSSVLSLKSCAVCRSVAAASHREIRVLARLQRSISDMTASEQVRRVWSIISVNNDEDDEDDDDNDTSNDLSCD